MCLWNSGPHITKSSKCPNKCLGALWLVLFAKIQYKFIVTFSSQKYPLSEENCAPCSRMKLKAWYQRVVIVLFKEDLKKYNFDSSYSLGTAANEHSCSQSNLMQMRPCVTHFLNSIYKIHLLTIKFKTRLCIVLGMRTDPDVSHCKCSCKLSNYCKTNMVVYKSSLF